MLDKLITTGFFYICVTAKLSEVLLLSCSFKVLLVRVCAKVIQYVCVYVCVPQPAALSSCHLAR